MPDIGSPDKREKMESRLNDLLNRAVETKKPFIEVAEVSRRVYADCPLNQLSPFAPRTHWNNYRQTVQTYRSKLGEGDPQIMLLRTNNEFPVKAAEEFQANLQSLAVRENSSNIIQSATNDVVQYGHGYVYVHPGPEWEWLSWFDVFVDGAVTEAKMLSSARYIIIRRYYDAAQYIARRGAKKLRALGYKIEDPYNHDLPMTSQMFGREAVGIDYNVSLKNNMAESRTGAIKGSYGNPFELGGSGNYSTSADRDGLICEHEFLLQDADSPSGWSRYYVFEGKIVESDYLPEHHNQPPIAHWAGDFLSGQFEQPSLLLRVLPNQVAKTFVADKFLQHVAWLDNPTMVDAEENRNSGNDYTGAPGELLYEISPGTKRFLEPPDIPNQYFEINEVLKEESQDNTGNYNVVQGKEPGEAKSGVAIERLQQNAEMHFQLLLSARDEFFKDLARLSVVEMFANVLEDAEQRATMSLGEPQLERIKEVVADEESPEFQEAKEIQDNFLPEGFQGITFEAVRDDMVFNFKIVPPMTRDDKIAMLLRAVTAVQPLSMGMPDLAVQLAATITETPDIGEELIAIIQPYMQRMQQQQAQEQQQQQEQQAESGQVEHARAMEMETQKAALAENKGDNKNGK